MGEAATAVNPRVLRWARERSGYSLDEVARRMKQDVARIVTWESGEDAPTYVQLEGLAYKLYKRPIAVFFFPDPPEEADPRQEFRTLPEFERESLSEHSLQLLRKAQAMQIALEELNDGVNPCDRRIFDDIAVEGEADVQRVAKEVREYLGVPLEVQKGWRGTEEALKNWRACVEEKGIFVFKDSFKQGDISAFSLLHDEFPVIYLNNSTAKTRQLFSLFHELLHILQGTSGIAKRDNSYIDFLEGDAKRIETFCNRFAGEFLVPSDDFQRFADTDFRDDEVVGQIAREYCVSREVVLRKALDTGRIGQRYYEEKAREWAEQYKAQRAKPGGNYFATQATYLGERFLSLAFSRHYQGRCSTGQLADYLGVRVKSLSGLEPYALRHDVS